MNLFQFLLILSVLLVSGCSQGFEIEENQETVVEDIAVEEFSIENTSLEIIDEDENPIKENIEETSDNIQNNIRPLILNQETPSLEFNGEEVYKLQVTFNDINYDYSLEVKKEKNDLNIYVDGIKIPISDLPFFLKFSDRTFSIEELDDGRYKLLISKNIGEDLFEDKEVVTSEIKLYVIEKDDFTVLEWEDSLKGVKWYKIMHSTTNSNIRYPEDDAIGVYEGDREKRFEHWKQQEGTNYYRISAVLEDDSVVHSEVSKVIIQKVEEVVDEVEKEVEEVVDEVKNQNKSTTVFKKYCEGYENMGGLYIFNSALYKSEIEITIKELLVDSNYVEILFNDETKKTELCQEIIYNNYNFKLIMIEKNNVNKNALFLVNEIENNENQKIYPENYSKVENSKYDLNGDGYFDSVESEIILKYTSGFPENSLLDEVQESFLEINSNQAFSKILDLENQNLLDVNDDSIIDTFVDGFILMRYVQNYSPENLVDEQDLNLESERGSSSEAIYNFIHLS